MIKRKRRRLGVAPKIAASSGISAKESKVTIIDYNEKEFHEKEIKNIGECCVFKDAPTVTWINIDGLTQHELLEKLTRDYELHPLVVEDILNTDQRPKMEDFGSYIYMVMKMLSYNQAEAEVEIEQVSMILGNNFLISFQEKEGDVFDSIRERIRTAKGRIRKSGVDYLVYTLIDAVIDNYFLILEKIGEKIEVLEEELINTPTQETMRNIHSLKREMIFLRKSVWPMRELINGLQKSESSVIKKSTGIFLRDVYDHTIQVIDTVESLRDMASGMLDIYLSSISNRMNEVMKVLTIFAAIFIPLTFIAGVYGMNFKFMPELEWKYGYFVALSLMAAVGITLVLFFKRKKWF